MWYGIGAMAAYMYTHIYIYIFAYILTCIIHMAHMVAAYRLLRTPSDCGILLRISQPNVSL